MSMARPRVQPARTAWRGASAAGSQLEPLCRTTWTSCTPAQLVEFALTRPKSSTAA